MIIGYLSRWEQDKRYLPALFDRAVRYLLEHDLSGLPEGRHPIEGDVLLVAVQRFTTQDSAERLFEIHERYIDIQVPLNGREKYGFHPLPPTLPVLRDKMAANDVAMYPHPEGAGFTILEPMQYAVFFPGEQHCPGCSVDNPQALFKCVLKIRADAI